MRSHGTFSTTTRDGLNSSSQLSELLVHPRERTMSGTLAFLLLFASVAALTEEPALDPSQLKLEEGDLIALGSCRCWGIDDAPVVMYQIARLGHNSVASFQQANGLKVDGVVGPKTRQATRRLYKRSFEANPSLSDERSSLSLTILPTLGDGGKTMAEASILNTTDKPMRFIEKLCQDDGGRFSLTDIPLAIDRSARARTGGQIGCFEKRYSAGDIKEELFLAPVYGAATLPRQRDRK